MANSKRESFRPQPIDRSNTIDLPTAGFPESVTVDLDAEDPNAFVAVENTESNVEDNNTAQDTDDTQERAYVDPPSVQKRIHRLKAETSTERKAREAAETRAVEAERRAADREAEIADLRKRLEGSTGALAASMKSDRENRLADAQARLERAHAEGDSAAIAKATREIGEVSAELVQINSRAPAPRTQEQERPPVAQPQRQVPNIAPNALAWIARNNAWWDKDVARTRLALAVHENVVARGIQPTSPDYTKELDKGMKAVYPDHIAYDQPVVGSDDGPPTPRRTNVVAEGSRDTGKVLNPRQVELSASQLAIAKQLNITPQQYAASLAKYPTAQRNGA